MKKKIIIGVAIILVVLVIIVAAILINKKENNKVAVDNTATDNIIEENNNTKNNIEEEINTDEENQKIDEIKYNTGATGDSNIYEVQIDSYDGREVVVVKPSIKYKVAFAGMVKNDLPQMQEINQIYEDNKPEKNGIWVESDSRDKILSMFNNSGIFNNTYTIDQDGYMKVQEENNHNENDTKVINAINSEKQYILSVSSICYIVDDLTGEIQRYSFENMDRYQTYEYFDNGNQYIIFLTENKNNQLSDSEIINSLIGLLEQ